MSVGEIKTAIDRMTPEERAEISAHLRRKSFEDTPERRRKLSQIMDEMDAGKKHSLAELKRRHVARVVKGA